MIEKSLLYFIKLYYTVHIMNNNYESEHLDIDEFYVIKSIFINQKIDNNLISFQQYYQYP